MSNNLNYLQNKTSLFFTTFDVRVRNVKCVYNKNEKLTDLGSIASCPILCTKRSSFRDVLSISLQGRRILLRLFSGLILSQHLGR